MEVMEEGNLMDRVPILLQRDLAYYQQHQSVLQENLCVAVVGGVLDFPHYASFAAVKMVLWWEEEHIAAFRTVSGLLQGEEVASMSADRGCGGVAKTSAPSTMVKMVTQSAAQLLEHLHTLSQEALDHADLQVLTGTLGAAALVKNCIWTYNQNLIKADIGLSLVNSYKLFQEMGESLAERLLDLHCRLISLYVLQDADCLNWEHNQPFFEGERGSFVIQMWWLYMQGTRSNLWTTVPPKTAQRVLAGMLNESLTILNVRYTQARASSARAMLIATDISNLLQCVRQILPAICTSAAELTGCNVHSQLVMDVHAKCHALLTCLLLRASPLAILHKVFHKGVSNVQCLSPTPTPSIVPWMTVISPEDLKLGTQNMKQLIPTQAVSLELAVLLAQPQPSWHLLLKVLMMQHCWVASRLMLRLAEHPYLIGNNEQEKKCKGFLCSGDCFLPPTSVEQALVHILITVGSTEDLACTLLPRLDMTNQTWAESLNRSQVWNQMKPPWLQAMVDPLTPCLEPVVKILKKAAKEGAKKKEVIVLCVELLCQICDCLPPGLGACCTLLTDALPANSNPLAGSVLIQVLMSALYTQLIDTPIAETLCSLQDNQLTPLVNCVSELGCLGNPIVDLESSPHVCEVQVSQLLLMPTGWKALKVMYTYLKTNSGWLIEALGRTPPPPNAHTLLYTMFHVGGNPFDQLLSGTWSPDWMSLFKSPLGLTPKAIWQQLSLRPEFWEDRQLTEHDHAVVCKLRNLFTSFQ